MTGEPVFAALSDATRRTLLTRLADGGPATATQLAAELPITRQAVVKHLEALREARLVTSARAGREVRYTVTPEPLADAVGWIADVGGQWDSRLAALQAQFSSPRAK
ncbi:MAG TPA: metalloregulator ArsR/SmtB family transcription factor [Thermoleophilaceae bacterium]|nr:metalloregulator ArsR/SmtB family transcription factor [Thermoleophilaceae bacterium]